MKTIFLACMLIGTAAMAQQNKPYTFSGTIKGKDTGYLYMLVTDLYEKRVKDSAKIIHGSFEFRGTMQHPLVAFVFDGSSPRSANDPNSVSFLLDPGTTTAVLQLNDFKHIQLTGATTRNTLDSLEKLNTSTPTTSSQSGLTGTDLNYIKTHPASYASAYLLRTKSGISLSEKENYLNDLTPELQQSAYGKYIRSAINSSKLGIPGTKAIDFSTLDINGKKISLSDFRGRYVLLDFWASWCIPCRKGNPHLLEVYTRYRDKGFEIIGVSDDDGKEDAWRKAVEKDRIGVWRHVLRGIDKKKVAEGDLNFSHHPLEISSSKYAVTGLPTKILIDPSGAIIGRYTGAANDEEELDKKLSQVIPAAPGLH